MRTRAKADGDDRILNGAKCWITNGGKSSWHTVMAVTEPEKGANGISAFMVRIDDEGFTIGRKEKSSASRAARSLSCISRTAAFRAIGSSVSRAPDSRQRWRRWTTPGPTIGAPVVAQGAVDAAIAYTKGRKQFGKSISDFRAVQFMLAGMAMKVEAAG